MTGIDNSGEYAGLDRPEVTRFLFHPRPEVPMPVGPDAGRDMLIPVAPDVKIGARFHMVDKKFPNLLFFHGNGEIVADYDDMADVYGRMGVNFLPVDYRGYGRSTGSPTVSAMMRDCHLIWEFVGKWLAENGYTGPVVVMGRSLGSASALELAAEYPEQIAGLIIESGFAYAGPLLTLLGVDIRAIGFEERTGFRSVDKIKAFTGPTLIIHAEHDHIIPFSDGRALFEASGAADKKMLAIPGADHNNLLYVGYQEYMTAVQSVMSALTSA